MVILKLFYSRRKCINRNNVKIIKEKKTAFIFNNKIIYYILTPKIKN